MFLVGKKINIIHENEIGPDYGSSSQTFSTLRKAYNSVGIGLLAYL